MINDEMSQMAYDMEEMELKKIYELRLKNYNDVIGCIEKFKELATKQYESDILILRSIHGK